MKVSRLIGILITFYVYQTNGLHLRYDLTNLINAVRARNLSVEEFVSHLEFKHVSKEKSAEVHGLYAPDCKILECVDQIHDAIQIVQKAVNSSAGLDIILQFKFRIDINTLANRKMPIKHTKVDLPTGKYWIHFTLPDNITCKDLYNITAADWKVQMNPLSWFSPNSVHNILGVGFGYNEDLISCHVFYKIMPLSSYFLVSMDFGTTPGVVESLGLFQKRMEYLHFLNIKFIKLMIRFTYTEPYIDYYVKPQSLGDGYHRRLLHSFWKLTVTRNESRMGALLPLPLLQTKLPTLVPNKIIPYIDSESCLRGDDIPWYATSALGTLSKHFEAAVLTHFEWKLLKSSLALKYYSRTNMSNIHRDIRLDVIIDYTDWLAHSPVEFAGCAYKWETIEAELNSLSSRSAYPLENVAVKTLLFAVENHNGGNYSVYVNRGFAKKMSSRVTIGCGFQSTSFGALNDTTTQAVVTACRQVNGSLYTLQSYFKLESITFLDNVTSRQFENDVRPKLEDMKTFRNLILVKHLKTTVYFQLRFDLQIKDNHATVFCNREALSLNEQIEGISNWALLNEIPLIIGRAFDDIRHRTYQTWFSVLRPTLEVFSDVNPYLVVRNYPKIRDSMDIEPCIEWTKERPVLSSDYFHNNYIGSIFDATDWRKEQPISSDEYEILLQFILHRFDLVEVVLGKDSYEGFVSALNKLVTNGLVDHTKKFLFLFYDRREVTEQEKIEAFNAFLNFTKVTLGTSIDFIKGITVVLGSFFEQTGNLTTEGFINATYSRHTMLAGLGKPFNLTMGVVMEKGNCEEIILESLKSGNPLTEINKFLNTVGYLFCYEILDLNSYNNPKTLGKLFDTHLYIKKSLQDFYPQIHLHFRVSVNVNLTETTLNDYLILISHMKNFAIVSNISYIIVEAFDGPSFAKNGWWKITNNSNLALPSVYEEKYSDFVGSQTWRPSIHSKPISTTANDKQNKVLVVIVSVLVLIIVGLGLGLWHYKNKGPFYLSNEEEYEFRNGQKVNGENNSFELFELESFNLDINQFPYNEQLEIAKDEFRFEQAEKIGSGTFGRVYKMRVNGFESEVAVKIPQLSWGKDAVLGALREIKILAFVGTHENVIRILGAYTKGIRRGRVYIVTEFCSEGSLLTYLRTSRNETVQQPSSSSSKIEKGSGTSQEKEPIELYEMLRFATEIANGMEFISKKKVVHADLATRNVLLDHNRTVKICDFGLSRKLYNYKDHVKKDKEPLPWRWMAIETLKKMEFSTKSDVWSYGITVWEIFTLGDVPYPTMKWDDDFLLKLEQGLRPIMPIRSSDEAFKLMESCWNITPNLRPNFAYLSEKFSCLKIDAYQQVI